MAYYKISLSSGSVTLIDYPLECLECHQKTTPNFSSYRTTNSTNTVFAHLFCPNPQCQKSYIAEYERSVNGYHYFKKFIIGQPKKEYFPAEIETLSPMFTKIYNEAFTAEQQGLLEISGVGYRKALEFLIKDFLINKNPEKTDAIKEILLGKCINTLVEDTRIKTAAKRAVWLGNDHTHYTKKWEDKDLADLKKLIRLTVNWVESEILTSDLEISMPE